MVLTVVILWPLTGTQSIVYLCSLKSLIYEIKICTTGSYQQHRQSFASDGSHSTVLSGWKHLSKNTKDRKCLKHDFSFFPSRQVWFRFFEALKARTKRWAPLDSGFGTTAWAPLEPCTSLEHWFVLPELKPLYAGWKSWGRSRAQWLLRAWA